MKIFVRKLIYNIFIWISLLFKWLRSDQFFDLDFTTFIDSIFDTAYAHSMFNSAEKFDAGYRVQVATAPEFPQINEPSQFLS